MENPQIHLVNWNEDLIQKYFDYLRTFKPKKKMKIFIEYLESTYFKFRPANGSFDPQIKTVNKL